MRRTVERRPAPARNVAAFVADLVSLLVTLVGGLAATALLVWLLADLLMGVWGA